MYSVDVWHSSISTMHVEMLYVGSVLSRFGLVKYDIEPVEAVEVVEVLDFVEVWQHANN